MYMCPPGKVWLYSSLVWSACLAGPQLGPFSRLHPSPFARASSATDTVGEFATREARRPLYGDKKLRGSSCGGTSSGGSSTPRRGRTRRPGWCQLPSSQTLLRLEDIGRLLKRHRLRRRGWARRVARREGARCPKRARIAWRRPAVAPTWAAWQFCGSGSCIFLVTWWGKGVHQVTLQVAAYLIVPTSFNSWDAYCCDDMASQKGTGREEGGMLTCQSDQRRTRSPPSPSAAPAAVPWRNSFLLLLSPRRLPPEEPTSMPKDMRYIQRRKAPPPPFHHHSIVADFRDSPSISSFGTFLEILLPCYACTCLL